MLRYETKVVKVYFFAFKLTRKKKHHRKLEQYHIHHSGAKYISDMRIDPHRSHILSHNSLMWEASVTGRRQAVTECQEPLLAFDGYRKDSSRKYNHSVLRMSNTPISQKRGQTLPKPSQRISHNIPPFFTKTISVFNRFKLAPIPVQLCRPKFQIN